MVSLRQSFALADANETSTAPQQTGGYNTGPDDKEMCPRVGYRKVSYLYCTNASRIFGLYKNETFRDHSLIIGLFGRGSDYHRIDLRHRYYYTDMRFGH